LSNRAYGKAIEEVQNHEWCKSATPETLISAMIKCQEFDMPAATASEMIWGIVGAVREEYGD
jgi:hypothetical protein